MSEAPELSVVIPAYNEEKGIAKTLGELTSVAESEGYEIIVVDDGSGDATGDIVKTFPSVRLIRHPHNKGYGAALRTGIREARGRYVLFCDADGQHRIEDVVRVAELARGFDMVVGKRIKGSHVERRRVLGKKVIELVANYLSGVRIPDFNSGLRVFRREIILKYLHLFPNGFSASTTSTLIMLKRGYDIQWEPIQTEQRIGKSSVKQLKDGLQALLLVVRLIALFDPLKVFLPTSSLLVLFGIVWSIVYFPGGFSVFAVVLILSGILIFFFGILCDQVSQLRLEKYE